MLYQIIKKRIIPTLQFLILFLFVFQSCENKIKKTIEIENDSKSEELIDAEVESIDSKPALVESNVIPNEFESLIRPNEKIMLGKTYTDTVKYVNYNDEGDNWLLIIEKNKDSIYLINDIENNFVRGDELEIQWKMDSIRYAGDDSFVNFREFLISAKKIASLKLIDKNSKILWRETVYNKDLGAEINTILLNDEYIKNISDPEKAAVAYIATFIGNECEWDGKVNENRSNLKCKILSALDLGYQCSNNHIGFLRNWFRNDKTILKELESCPTTPDGATVQDTFDEINIEVKGNNMIVFFKASGINLREARTWNWTEKHFFEFKENELILIKKDISPIKRSAIDVGVN